MEMNEVKVLTEDQIAKCKARAIDRFCKASAKAEKAGWDLAKVVYETVNSENFKEVFGNLKNYAEALNFSKASLSKMAKAYERRLYMIGCEIETENYTLTQIEEISAIPEDDTLDFIEVKSVSDSDTCKEIRDKAKSYNNQQTETEELEVVEEPEVLEDAGDIHIMLSAWFDGSDDFLQNIDHSDCKYITMSQLTRIMAIINE